MAALIRLLSALPDTTREIAERFTGGSRVRAMAANDIGSPLLVLKPCSRSSTSRVLMLVAVNRLIMSDSIYLLKKIEP